MGNTQLSDEFIEENIHLSNFVMCRKINLPQYKLTFSKLKYIYVHCFIISSSAASKEDLGKAFYQPDRCLSF
mgnify:CR=1 FL=1